MKKMMIILGGIVLGGFLLDGLYAAYIAVARSRVEAGITRNVDGVKVGCEEFSMGEGNTAVLLVHGFADSPALWPEMAAGLADAGVHVKAIRLRGFAGPRSEVEGLTADRWQEQVKTGIRELADHHDEVWIVAHSLGCAISLGAVQEQDEEIAGIVLMAPLLNVAEKRSPVLSPRGWFRVLDTITFLTSATQSIFPVDAADPVIQQTHPRDVFIDKEIIRSLFEACDDAWAVVDHEFPPVLLMQAEGDPVVDNQRGADYVERMNAPRKESLVFPRSGHIIPRDVHWPEALEAMITFMNNTSAHE